MNAVTVILDEGIANVTVALQQSGSFNNTLIVVSSDNGGWIHLDRGGNIYALRSGKVTDFGGGVSTVTCVSNKVRLMP